MEETGGDALSQNFPMTHSPPLRVALVEDDPSARDRFVSAIQGDPTLQLAAVFDRARPAMAWLETHSPDVLLTDLGLPDVPGLAVIKLCVERNPRTNILVISMFEDESHVMRSLEAGATGYLLKDALGDEICQRVREVATGGSPMTPVIARLVLNRMRPPPDPGLRSVRSSVRADDINPLTDKELLVLTRIAQGFSYQEIADLLKLSPHTIHAHTKSIYRKLAVHSRTEAVFEAGRLGLIDP